MRDSTLVKSLRWSTIQQDAVQSCDANVYSIDGINVLFCYERRSYCVTMHEYEIENMKF